MVINEDIYSNTIGKSIVRASVACAEFLSNPKMPHLINLQYLCLTLVECGHGYYHKGKLPTEGVGRPDRNIGHEEIYLGGIEYQHELLVL